MKCTPSPTADIRMEAMPGAGGGSTEGVELTRRRGRDGEGSKGRWRFEGVEREHVKKES